MYKKKISTMAIITILTLSIVLAIIPMALAIGTPTLSPISGNAGDLVAITGSGATPFGPVKVYWDDLGTMIDEGYADSAGNYAFTGPIASVVIPEDIVGPHNIIVMDGLSSTIDSAVFTIIPEIEISTDQGLPGDEVTVTGTGFGDELVYGLYLGVVNTMIGEAVTLSSGTPATGTLSEPAVVIGYAMLAVDVTIDGEVNGVPVTGTAVVLVTDDGEGHLAGSLADITVDDGVVVESGEVDVSIIGSINYKTGVFTLIASGIDSAAGTGPVTDIGVTVNSPCVADYVYAEYNITPSGMPTTTPLGSIDAEFTIPAIAVPAYGDYDILAIDTDSNMDTYVTLTVDYYVTASPASGPTGITVTISGRIPASTPYELRLDDNPIDSGTSNPDTTFTNTHVLSQFLALGNHEIKIVWGTINERITNIMVTPQPQVAFAPTQAVGGAVITISSVPGFPFSAGANITLYLGTTVVNSTQMDARFGPTVSSGPAAGSFLDLEFTVPTLAPGFYSLKVVDQYGATSTIYTFQVLPTPVTTITLRGTAYYPGDTLSFNIVSTDVISAGPTCTIKDPTGATWWTADWNLYLTTTGPMSTVLYQWQLFGIDEHATLPADAPLGSWNWTITYTPVSTGVLTKATGLFTVAELPTMQTVLDKLDELEATITDVVTDSEGDLTALINTKVGQITTKLDDLNPKVQGIEDMGIIIATDVGEIKVAIEDLDLGTMGVDITAIKGDVATIKTNIGTVTTNVATLDAKVVTLSGDVATVSTTLGTLEGTVTAIDGKVATVSTNVGTIKADVSDIKAKPDVDMTPVWIAVVLSLIAAIAAIFAVVTIRQKIAG